MISLSMVLPASRLIVGDDERPLVIRPLTVKDAPAIVAAIEDSLVELREFMPFAHHPQTVESQVQRLQTVQRDKDLPLGLFRADEPRMLAACGLHARVPLNPRGVEIGFWTRTGETKRGWATLMTRVLLAYAFEGLGMDRVQIIHNVENAGSRRVIEKCGFQLEGRIRNAMLRPLPEHVAQGLSSCQDTLSYSLLPADARALPWYPTLLEGLRVYDILGQEVLLGT